MLASVVVVAAIQAVHCLCCGAHCGGGCCTASGLFICKSKSVVSIQIKGLPSPWCHLGPSSSSCCGWVLASVELVAAVRVVRCRRGGYLAWLLYRSKSTDHYLVVK